MKKNKVMAAIYYTAFVPVYLILYLIVSAYIVASNIIYKLFKKMSEWTHTHKAHLSR